MKHGNVSIFIPHNGCPCRCSFCNQNRITGAEKQPSPREVRGVIAAAGEQLGQRAKNAEIAFFGGSFTAIGREYMLRLLEEGAEGVEKYGFMGIRISTRPDKIDPQVLSVLKAHRVTSIELGAQSMRDRVLLANGRGHDAQSVRTASRLVQQAGFQLGLQMMTGLYGSTRGDDLYTAEEIIRLRPATVRIYPTVTLEDTKLCDLFKSGEYVPPTLEETTELCARLIPLFESAGVQVIRVGLHASDEISAKRVAGPYHPAFKELCLSRIYLEALKKDLEGRPRGAYEVRVNPRLLSAVTGQKRANIAALAALGYDVKLIQDPLESRFRLVL